MNPRLEELLVRIQDLQDEVEETYRQAREDFERQRQALAGELKRRQRQYKVGLAGFLLHARPLALITSPVIYAGWIPFLLMDLFVSLYQAICFRVYHIPRVHRADYLVFDRGGLAYLNAIERFNCFYCAYCNGIAAYTREVAARTEQYWCPIKYARRLPAAHNRYPKFVDPGDADSYRAELIRLRQDYEDLKSTLK